MAYLTRRAIYRISNQLRVWAVRSPVLGHPLDVSRVRPGSLVALQAPRPHSKLHIRAVSSSADETAGSSSSRKTHMRRIVHTLDPDRLRSEDLVDFSGLGQARIRFTSKEARASWSNDYARVKYYSTSDQVDVPFPANTQGFLYFLRSPHSHPAAGEIRFRVVRPEDSSLPATQSFLRGSDLMVDHRHSPWRIHLTTVFTGYPAIWRKLVDEGIVSLNRAVELEGLVPKRIYRRSKVLDSITDPFILDLGNCIPRVMLLHNEGIFRGPLFLSLTRPKQDTGPKGFSTGTTSGKALVRFEMAKFAHKRGASDSIPKVVLRVLKIVEPSKAEDAEVASQIFQEGQLVQRYDFRTGKTAGPWWITRGGENRFITPTSKKLLEEIYLPAKNSGSAA